MPPSEKDNDSTPLETTNQLREFFDALPEAERDLVITTLDLQMANNPALSAKEKQSKLEALILKQVS